MTEIIIAGIGQTPAGEHWDRSLRSLAAQAIRQALEDAGGLAPQALYAANVLAPDLSRQAHLAALLADQAGLTGLEAATFEAGGASGAAALRQGVLAIQSGMLEVVLVVGVEKFSDAIGPQLEQAAASQTDSEYEAVHGLTPTAQAALLARRYQHESGMPADGLAGFPLTAHANAAGNPHAMYRKALDLKAYQQAELVCDPLNLLDIAPQADGAAAVVLARRDRLAGSPARPLVAVTASSAAGDTLALHDRPNPLAFEAARRSVAAALQAANLERHEIDLFGYFDAYSIHADLSLEAAGFAAPGQGWELAAGGHLGRGGQIPCATMGGLKGRGNPLGATGLYQAVEAVLQLRGQAGPCQIPGARRALIQSLAGPAALAVTHILERIDEE